MASSLSNDRIGMGASAPTAGTVTDPPVSAQAIDRLNQMCQGMGLPAAESQTTYDYQQPRS
jgi:hypothetical protein